MIVRLFWDPMGHKDQLVSLPKQEHPLSTVAWDRLWPVLCCQEFKQLVPLSFLNEVTAGLSTFYPPRSGLIDRDIARAALRRVILGWHTATLHRAHPWVYARWLDDATRHPMLKIPLVSVAVVLGTGEMHPFKSVKTPEWAEGIEIQPTVALYPTSDETVYTVALRHPLGGAGGVE